jgi:putative superfamily III holin-X
MASTDDIGTMPPRTERSVASLFGDLARETSRLFRQEVALAKAELVANLGKLGTGAGELVVGGFIAYAGLLVLLAAAVLGLSEVLAPWLSALIVGAVVLLIGLGVALKGKRDVGAKSLVPDRTLRTLREDAEWAREQMR